MKRGMSLLKIINNQEKIKKIKEREVKKRMTKENSIKRTQLAKETNSHLPSPKLNKSNIAHSGAHTR